jgi:hypothetical protein
MTVETPSAPQTTQTAPPPAPRRRLPRPRKGVAIGLVAAVVAAAAAILLLGGGDDADKGGKVEGPEGSKFTVGYPETWRALSKDEVADLPGDALAVLRRKDNKGFVVVSKQGGKPPKNADRLMRDLGRELRERVPDFKRRSSKRIRVRAGQALFTSYIRKRTGTVHSIVIVPAGKQTFTLNTISRGGANDAAREIGRIILSFDA